MISQFPLFYSYLVYVFVGSSVAILIYWSRPSLYPTCYWLYFLVCLLAEFAVLIEISDHMFARFPAIRRLGRILAISIATASFLVYIIPSLFKAKSSSSALLDFSMRTSLAKGMIIIALLVAARSYRLPLGRNVAGLLLGFGLYVGVNIANYAAAQGFGRTLYAGVLSVMYPLAYTLCLFVWTVAMWRFQPVQQPSLRTSEPSARAGDELADQLGRLNNSLGKLLRKS